MGRIKVRAWDKSANKFHYLDYLWNSDWYTEPFEKSASAHSTMRNNNLDAGRLYNKGLLILELLIGRKDKDGVELYQGDIVLLNNKNYDPESNFYEGKAIIVADDCGYHLEPIPKLEEPNQYDSSMFWNFCEEDTTEKIGTIHENPELLEANNERK